MLAVGIAVILLIILLNWMGDEGIVGGLCLFVCVISLVCALLLGAGLLLSGFFWILTNNSRGYFKIPDLVEGLKWFGILTGVGLASGFAYLHTAKS